MVAFRSLTEIRDHLFDCSSSAALLSLFVVVVLQAQMMFWVIIKSFAKRARLIGSGESEYKPSNMLQSINDEKRDFRELRVL